MTGDEAVRKAVQDRSGKMRKQIEDDIKANNKVFQRKIPETAKWHFTRKPYDGVYKRVEK